MHRHTTNPCQVYGIRQSCAEYLHMHRIELTPPRMSRVVLWLCKVAYKPTSFCTCADTLHSRSYRFCDVSMHEQDRAAYIIHHPCLGPNLSSSLMQWPYESPKIHTKTEEDLEFIEHGDVEHTTEKLDYSRLCECSSLLNL